MISFENFTISDKTAIYLQIIMYIKREIVSGNIKNNDEMPSRRVLSALLGVNPNTVQKAYRILEEENLIISHSGTKSSVSIDEERLEQLRADLVRTDMESIIFSLKQMGMNKSEAINLIEKYWE